MSERGYEATDGPNVAVIELLFAAFDKLAARERPWPLMRNSQFEVDGQTLAEYNLLDWTWTLRQSAIDHVRSLRLGSGQEPGSARWFAFATWTVLRGALECASQALWLIAPVERDTRMLRLLRLVWNDMTSYMDSARLVNRGEQLKLINDGYLDWVEQFDRVYAAWLERPKNGIKATIRIVECVREASKTTRILPVDITDGLWRTASGYAHGRQWAFFNASHIELDHHIDGNRSAVVGTIDLATVSKMLGLVVPTMQYVDWAIRQRSGYLALPLQLEVVLAPEQFRIFERED